MGLIELGRYRVGFWMAERTGTPEPPPSPVLIEEGTRIPGGATLVLTAADEASTPAWSILIHEPDGASLVLRWMGHLVVGLGTALVVIDEGGHIVSRYRTGDEWVTAASLAAGLLLIGRRTVQLLDAGMTCVSQWSFQAEGVHFIDADEGVIRLALIDGEDWRDVRLDIRTGHEVRE